MNKAENYKNIHTELSGLLDHFWLTNLANFTALLMQHLPNINWVGFYLRHGDQLYLGPFQGKPACLQIPFSKGVCGHAATTRSAVVVKDVHDFDGHIVCDVASRSEIVIPLIHNDQLFGVLDIDSPLVGRFDADDLHQLSSLIELLVKKTKWPSKNYLIEFSH